MCVFPSCAAEPSVGHCKAQRGVEGTSKSWQAESGSRFQ